MTNPVNSRMKYKVGDRLIMRSVDQDRVLMEIEIVDISDMTYFVRYIRHEGRPSMVDSKILRPFTRNLLDDSPSWEPKPEAPPSHKALTAKRRLKL